MTGDNYPKYFYSVKQQLHKKKHTNVRQREPCNTDVNSSLCDVKPGRHDGMYRPLEIRRMKERKKERNSLIGRKTRQECSGGKNRITREWKEAVWWNKWWLGGPHWRSFGFEDPPLPSRPTTEPARRLRFCDVPWVCSMWYFSRSLRLKRAGQMGQRNCGSTAEAKHSYRKWRSKVDLKA